MKRIELLAPAKDYRSAAIAVDAGADAIYIGGARFGARQGAANSLEEIERVVAYAHRFGVRVYATMNTLLWEEELAAAERDARAMLAAGVDALIVQDMAFQRMGLDCELHASTQVQIRTPEMAAFLGKTGFRRVILERALSLEQIRAVCAATEAEVECFVHGAICVGYSGRCYLSRSLSSRSGNRGACSQPCRQRWNLTDGKGRLYVADKHLLSVRDLNLSQRLGELLDAGVTSFKIEGRLKDVDYIRNVVSYYRGVLDRELALRPHLVRASMGQSIPDFTPNPSKSFTRGDTTWFFDGPKAGVASFDTPKAVGERLGEVVQATARGYRIRSKSPLAAGDGICLITPEGLVGTNINAVEGEWVRPNHVVRVASGTPLYRNYDHQFHKQLLASRMRRTLAVKARLEASEQALQLTLSSEQGAEVTVACRQGFERAQNPERNEEAIRRQLMRTGDTIFRMEQFEITGASWFLPASLVADLRREGLQRLEAVLPQHHAGARPALEQRDVPYLSKTVTAEEGVTNSKAVAFYRDHGVERIVEPLELASTTSGACVMRSAYCLRREMGQCLKQHPRIKGELYLESGPHRYRLEFDCKRCEMSLIDATK